MRKSFNPDPTDTPMVKVLSPEHMIAVNAQKNNDDITFPLVGLERVESISIDEDRWHYGLAKRGVASVIDPATNNLYYEKSLPINLSYELSVVTTNIADMDELMRELLFKYTTMYFLTINLPYEADRKIKFGVVIDPATTIKRNSATNSWLSEGTLYESVLNLKCEGCVLVNYTPAKLKRYDKDLEIKID